MPDLQIGTNVDGAGARIGLMAVSSRFTEKTTRTIRGTQITRMQTWKNLPI